MQFKRSTISANAIGETFPGREDQRKDGDGMRKLAFIFVALVATLMFAPTANATRYHGACGGGSTIKDAIAGWKSHGVADDIAKQTGQQPTTDGSSEKILKDNMVVVYLTKAVKVTNYTCTGHHFKVLPKKKYLPVGTKLYMPEKDAPAPGSSKVTTPDDEAEQENCGNKAKGKMHVKRKGTPKPKKAKKKPAKKPVQTQTASQKCSIPGNPVDGSGNCIVQQNQQAVAGAGNCNSTNSGNLSGTGDTQGSCNQVNVTCNGMGSCSPSTTNVCTSNTTGGTGTTSGTGGTASSETCDNNTPPPTNPPPPASSASCTGLTVSQDLQVNLGVIATVTYQSSGTSLTNIRYDWGDGHTSNTTQASGFKYVYTTGGTYNVYAVLTFTDSNHNVTNVTCAATTVTPKDGTTGAGSTSGGTAGGTGSGGTAGTGTGTTCRDPNTGDIVPGPHDQFGFCV